MPVCSCQPIFILLLLILFIIIILIFLLFTAPLQNRARSFRVRYARLAPYLYWLQSLRGKGIRIHEIHAQFGEFTRLQIGDSNVSGYRNWFRISDYGNWRMLAKFKNVNGTWVNNMSFSQP